MIFTTSDLLNDGNTQYSISNKVKNKELFLIERGLYSTTSDYIIDEVYISKKYPFSIITGISAFYFYNLTDAIPEYFYLSTEQHSFPIRKDNVIQTYQDKSFFSLGMEEVETDNGVVRIYNLERLLIELFRLKEKYPRDIYYEVLESFRKVKYKLDFYKINIYLKSFKNGANLMLKIKESI